MPNSFSSYIKQKSYYTFKYIWSLLPNIFEFFVNYFILYCYKVNYNSFPKIKGIIFVRSHGTISIGRNVKINCKLSANPIGGPYQTSICVNRGAHLLIGDNSGISSTAIVCTVGISIGKNTLIGGGCRIYDTDFHSVNYNNRISSNDNTVNQKPIIIGNGVFIGANTTILKGVQIGDFSIVGTGSVVTKDIPSGQIWGGNPAKKLRQLSNEEIGR